MLYTSSVLLQQLQQSVLRTLLFLIHPKTIEGLLMISEQNNRKSMLAKDRRCQVNNNTCSGVMSYIFCLNRDYDVTKPFSQNTVITIRRDYYAFMFSLLIILGFFFQVLVQMTIKKANITLKIRISFRKMKNELEKREKHCNLFSI